MYKVVVSGGPHTGKTSLIEALSEAHPEFQYLPEPATIVVAEAQEKDITRWRDIFESPLQFCTLCMKQAVKAEKAIRADADFVFLDRSLVDTIAYARRDHCDELVPQVKALALKAMYDVVIFCEPVGVLDNRIEDEALAKKTHLLLKNAYIEMGIPLVSMPATDVLSRVTMVEDILEILPTR